MAEASDFKFCTQLGFAKAYHKISPTGKVRGLGLGEPPKILEFPYNSGRGRELGELPKI